MSRGGCARHGLLLPFPMRRLMLLRHAKSDWSEKVKDFDRPLAARGEPAAPILGAYMAREHLVPDCALVSPARRVCTSSTGPGGGGTLSETVAGRHSRTE